MSANPSLLRPLALRCLAALSLCSALAHGATGDLDPTFVAQSDYTLCITLQPDGQAVVARERSIARLDRNALADPFFNVSVNGNIRSMAVQADGKILIGGNFSIVSGISRRCLARLLPDGSVDPDFDPSPDTAVSTIKVAADGSVIVGGTFTQMAGENRSRVAKFAAGGELEAFHPSLDAECKTVDIQADGRILLGGLFSTVNGVPRSRIARVSTAGALDETFSPTPSGGVTWLTEQSDGKILLNHIAPQTQGFSLLQRLEASGAVDPTFQTDLSPSALIYSTALQADGKLLIGGSFNYQSTNYNFARLTSNGAFDPTFAHQNGGYVRTIAQTTDGKVLLGGDFNQIKGATRNGIARLISDPVTSTLTVAGGNNLEWRRDGTPAELKRVTFESRTFGGEWTFLGHGQRVNNTWRLNGVTLPENGIIRAYGYLPAAGSSSVHGEYLQIGNTRAEPEITRNGDVIPAGGTYQKGKVITGLLNTLEFEITNLGDRRMNQISVTQLAGCTVKTPPTPRLEPGETTKVRVEFRIQTVGPFNSSFTVTSDSPATPAYLVHISGFSSKEISPVFHSPSDIPVSEPGTMTNTHSFGQWTLGFAPEPGTVLTVVKGYYGSILPDLASGSIVSAEFNGVTYRFVAGYEGGPEGKDLTLTLLGDGVFTKSFAMDMQTLPVLHGDGSIVSGLNRLDAHGVDDPVYQTAGFQSPSSTRAILVGTHGEAYFINYYVTSQRLERLLNDGTRDPDFNVTVGSTMPASIGVYALISQPDGKILIAGAFDTINGQPRSGLARLHRDGTLDPTFDIAINLITKVNGILVDKDGNILVKGTQLPHPDGRHRTSIIRFSPDGTRDVTFAPESESSNGFLIQPDGKIISTHPDRPVTRYHPDGSVDTGFNVVTDGGIGSISMQADGKFLITGSFSKIGNHACAGIARIYPDGSPDPTFFGGTTRAGGNLILSDRHEPILVLNSGSVSGVAAKAATISNPTAATHVQMVGANTVRWMRQGGAAELQWVQAELIHEATGEAVPLGLAQRIPGGWEIISPVPISNATVHLSGPPIDTNGMRVMNEEFLEVGDVSPRIAVTRDQQLLPQGEIHDMGNLFLAIGKTTLMTIENRGAGTLEAPYATIEGPNAGDFTLIQSSAANLRAGERRSFRVNFKSTATGLRTAQLVIHSPDPMVENHIIPLRFSCGDTINPVFNSVAEIPFPETGFNPTLLKLGQVTLGFSPPPRTVLKVFGGSGNWSPYGPFADVPNKSYVSTTYNGVQYTFLATYKGVYELNLRLIGTGDPIPGFTNGATTTCNSIAVQPDGKMLVGGWTGTFPGSPSRMLTRLHPDGSVDPSFTAMTDNRIDAMVTQDDGRIIVGGLVNNVEGLPRRGIARLNHDGSLDRSFDLRAINGTKTRVDTNRLLKLRDGKILVGGQFTSMLDLPMQNIARLNADGTLDLTFTTTIQGTTPETAYIYAMIQQADGKILIGGRFTGVNGVPRFGLARLNEDGTLDTSFGDKAVGPNPGPVPGGSETRVSALISQPDGKIVLSGEFTSVLGQPRVRFARLNADGSLDTTFAPSANNTVSALALQEDGRLLASGLYTQVSGETRTRIARLNVDGSLDPEFQPEVDATIASMLLDRHGKVWIVGDFNNVSGLPIKGITKLDNDGTGLSLAITNDTTAFWSAGASAPVPREVKFELSTDGGTIWSPLGNATKVIGGWSLENLSLPPHGFLRAKGHGIASNRIASEIEETLLFGRPLTKIEQWRAETFGSPTNQRTGADLNDADKDGVKNLMEYAFNLDPQDIHSAQVPAWTNDSSQFEINFTPPANVEGVSYGVEWSSTMNPSDWHDVSNQGTGGGHRYVVPKDVTLKFMRVKVTNTGLVPAP